ncbi:MAG: metallophosphoesterase [Chloroflexi bacterium]|nr:metallophosphoesterase [Chloroflexota bacterium]
MMLPDGTQFLGVHASPGNDDGQDVDPSLTAAELNTMFANCDADLVCVGHTHWPADFLIMRLHMIVSR